MMEILLYILFIVILINIMGPLDINKYSLEAGAVKT